ncbi:alternative NAD(P)H-ubiquinone oxidoreductase C1 chloroplastic/mitochondrial [Prunus yedoensis var. nudiflora]|uniref:Alternative NAD(P)H-ubiquinone oxidoreductase C1 chloroplastic/mitochondrial n=1 Tax=Prunus yedoensis var. nudiflora TaxID=2094558 RepID=A0A314ZKS2_PRUYE|nr:alternative NAD(P)H-ubiquinone oxidoreductase C1 chloroplastic/mitochondrial [Prunus yedoensis var. nudiflora]
MSSVALAASASFVPFNSRAKHLARLFPGFSRRCGETNISLSVSSQQKGFRFAVASSASGTNGNVAEIPEAETAPQLYSWPDKKRPRVLLVDQSERFVFKPMLYELLSGEVDAWEIAPRFSDLLANTSVLFFQDKAKLLYPSDHLEVNGPTQYSCGGSVLLESGLLVEYDWLVLALGAEAKLDIVPGAIEFALPFSTLEDARKVDHKLRTLERRNFRKESAIRVAVVGCGYSGVELAATVSERLQDRDIVLWTVGNKSLLPKLEPHDRPYDLPLNARGQAETDETLRVNGHPRIFAVGDSCALRESSGRLLPSTAQVAFQQADFAGWNLWAAINDRPLLPFRFQNLGEMITLGRNDAAISPSFIEGLTLEGPIGHTARKLAYLIRLPTDEHRLKVGISWLTKSAIDSVASIQSTLTKVLSDS